MRNLSFLKDVLMSEYEYWIVASKTTYSINENEKDSIMIICIPDNIKRNLSYEEITIMEIEKLQNSYCEKNIFINENFAPFQRGIYFYSFYKGFPITSNIKDFLIEAIKLSSNDIYEYKQLIKEATTL